MIEYALNFMKEHAFDEESAESLCSDMKKIYSCVGAKSLFDECLVLYEQDIHTDFKLLLQKAREAGELVGVHAYVAEMLMCICLSKKLRRLYAEKGISDEIWFDSMSDIKWKLWECKAVKGIYGTFVGTWFCGWFYMTRFALGRLQFEITSFRGEYEKNGRVLHEGDKVINVHIPRTLTPLDKNSRDDAYARAREFFADEFKETSMAFVCSSWLLYPPVQPVLPVNSNIRAFAADYDVIQEKTYEIGTYPDMWRLFDMDYTGKIEDYPEDSSLRRAYKKFLLDGNGSGSGYGVFFA